MQPQRVIRMCQEIRVPANILDVELDDALAAVVSTLEQRVADAAPMAQWWDITKEEQ